MAKTITKTKARGKIRFRLHLYMGIDPRTGKQQWAGGTFATRKEAEQEEARHQLRRGSGDRIAPGRELYRDYMKGWLKMRERTGIKRGKNAGKPLAPGTLEDYRQLLGRFIFAPPKDAPPLGQLALAKLRPEHFERQGFEISREHPIPGDGFVDLVAERPGHRVAVEIETGKSDIKANLAKVRQADFDRLVLVATSPIAVSACQRAIEKADLEKEPSVELMTWLDV